MRFPRRCHFFSAALCLSLAPRLASAQAFAFDVGDITVPRGTGDRIIAATYPALSGQQGLGQELELRMQPAINSLAASLKAQVEDKLKTLDLSPFAANTATAGAAALRGNTVDHASFIKIFSLTASGSVAVTNLADRALLKNPSRLGDNLSNGIAPTSGIAPSAGAMLGINFGALHLGHLRFFDPNRLQLFVSAMHVNLTYNGDEILADTSNYGAHVKYQLLAPRALVHNTLVRWGGLNLATGYTYASTNLRFHTDLPNGDQTELVPFTVANQRRDIQLRGVWSGEANLGAHLRANTVPIEVSSFIQLLYVFTLFGGVAMDINWGRAQLDAQARAPLTISASAPGGTTSVPVIRPQPQVDYLVARGPVRIDGRGFLGLQLNAGVLAIYGQAMMDTSKTVMGNVGLRAFY